MSCTGKRRAAAVLALLLLIGGFFETDTERVHATASTRKKLQEAEEEKKKTEAELGQTKEDLEDLNEEKNALQGKLNTLNNQLQEVSAKLEELEAQIKDKKAEIEVTKAELADARATEEWQYECMKKRIQFMYETQDYIMLEMFFSSASFADLLNRSDYIEQLSAYDRKKLEEYIEIKEQIEEVEARLEEEQEELEEYRAQVEVQKSQVSGLVSQTSTSVAGKKNEISQAESEALAYEQQLVEQEENIKKLQEKLAEEIRLSQLAAQSAWRDISEVSFAEGDRYLLANLIYCEAGGESYAGQLGVGSVVINRVLSSVYPDSVVGVIYQGGQFSPVASGRLAAALAGGSATASCYQAADAAMSGNTNVGNCVYFRTPIEGLSGIQIGGHIFY
ncbi:MAG: cell wall hydrolase [Lachnospiraceae bacterium]|nr:cell wall hydrolase [Lachnospiraceae bacterium]MCI9108212.1 cell wall hydrolase [Lachnospiraceae bacterium]MCI9342006.1 cell wall hydrolase [Lachnospiraceae bacterium]